MQHLLASCFSFLLFFGHAQTVRHTEAHAFVPPVQTAATGLDFAVPDHHELVSGSYAGWACTGCSQTTNATSAAR